MTVSEVAKMAGVTRPAVLGAIRDGRLEATRVGVGETFWVWAIPRAAAEAWQPKAYRRAAVGRTGRYPRVKRLAEPVTPPA